MMSKYMIYAFDYPYYKGYQYQKQTNSLIVALFILVIWNFKYFGVTFEKRGK